MEFMYKSLLFHSDYYDSSVQIWKYIRASIRFREIAFAKRNIYFPPN